MNTSPVEHTRYQLKIMKKHIPIVNTYSGLNDVWDKEISLSNPTCGGITQGVLQVQVYIPHFDSK